MIKFLSKGLFRDQNKFLFPVIIVSVGVMLTTLMYSWMNGVFTQIIDGSAKFNTGHVKITTAGYDEISNQIPNDLCIINLDSIMQSLNENYSDYDWNARIRFGGLLDVPDENGETKTQSPVFGMAIDLLNENSTEIERFDLKESIVDGKIPSKAGEIIISDELAEKLEVNPGDLVTLLSSTANGGMAVYNFIISGKVKFGMQALDKGMIVADIGDIQYALNMPNSAGEILGFDKRGMYFEEKVNELSKNFNSENLNESDKYSLKMKALEDQAGLGEYLNYARSAGFIIVTLFILVMSVVLWNSGLMSGIRRYGEIGVRLAIGESKQHIYKSLLAEAVIISLAASFIGTVLGLSAAYFFQEVGFDLTDRLQNINMAVDNTIRAKVNTTSYYIGLIPGIFANILGTAIAGIAIFKRNTAELFKELEV